MTQLWHCHASFKPMLRSEGAELGCFPYCRQSCWTLPGSWEFCLLPKLCLKFHLVTFHHLFSHHCRLSLILVWKRKHSTIQSCKHHGVQTSPGKPFFLPWSAHFCNDCSCSVGEFSWLNGLVPADPNSWQEQWGLLLSIKVKSWLAETFAGDFNMAWISPFENQRLCNKRVCPASLWTSDFGCCCPT